MAITAVRVLPTADPSAIDQWIASYSSKTLDACGEYLTGELVAVNDAVGTALSVAPDGYTPPEPWVLAVGSTPAAHAVGRVQIPSDLHGVLEL
jgi:hypothetical protein